jgi:hypothetical protein
VHVDPLKVPPLGHEYCEEAIEELAEDANEFPLEFAATTVNV